MTRPESSERLVVRTDRRALLRLYIPIMVLGAFSLLLMVGLAAGVAVLLWLWGEAWLGILLGLLLVVPNLLCWAFVGSGYRRRLKVDEACVIDQRGLRLAEAQTGGTVFLPWETLAPVKAGGLAYTFRLRPGIGPDHPGIEGAHHRRVRHALRRTGLRLGYKGLTVDRSTIAGAIWHFSSGRVTVG